MKKTWKILMLVLLTTLLVSLAATALAAGEENVNNAFSWNKKGTLNSNGSDSLSVPLETDAVTLNVVVRNNNTGKDGAEIEVDELRFRTYTTIPGGEKEQSLDAKNGTSSAQYSLTSVKKDTYKVYVKGYETTKNVPFYIGVTGSYKIALSETSLTLEVGKKATLKAYYCADSAKTWTSSNEKVATVDSQGAVTAKGAGEATITLSAAGQTATAKVYVYAANMDDKTMGFNQSLQLKTSIPADQVSSTIWTPSDPSIVTVDANGKVTSKEKAGTATVTAKVTMKDSTVKEIKCKIKVEKGAPGQSADGSGMIGNMVIETGNWGKLHLRKEADKKSQSLGLYPSGTIVNVTSNNGTWAKVTVGGKSGYMMSKYLKVPGSSSGESGNGGSIIPEGKMIVKQRSNSFVYLRSSTSTADTSNVIDKIPSGSQVTLISWGKWYSKVQYGSKIGYVVTAYLTK